MLSSNLIPQFLNTRNLKSTPLIIGSTVAATLTFLTIIRLTGQSTPKKIIPSPRSTRLPSLSKAEQEDLPYPPDIFPGARDVQSPYGTIRVYEWGPPSGRKVLFVHGISTPCVALGGVAMGLVEKGCRVMLFDLWGRGYSDGVGDLPHDSRLYTTEILLAITSSPLAWTPEGFSLVGYSLGGGIAADFAAVFPELVKSLVLLAPSGLIRPFNFEWQSRLMYSGIIPDNLLKWIVGTRMRVPVDNTHQKVRSVEDAVSEEIGTTQNQDAREPLLVKKHPGLVIASAVQWQLDNHDGFVDAFISSIRNASIEGSEESWKKLGLRDDRVLILAGKSDPLIVASELEEDTQAIVGKEKVDFRVIDSGHQFPVTEPKLVVEEISGFWSL